MLDNVDELILSKLGKKLKTRQQRRLRLNLFGDIIRSHEVYDFTPTKDPSFHSLADTSKD
jgi:hypothetical protein